MRRWHVIPLLLLGAGGFAAATFAVGSGEHVACTPAHTIFDNGNQLGVIPSECVTATDQTVTETVTVTVTAPTTTTAPPPPPPPPPPVALLFNGDFETGNFSQWQHVSDPNPSSPHSPMVVRSPVTQGVYSAKLPVDPTDTYITGSGATSTRLDLYENSNTAWASEGKDVWEHAYVMFPTVVNSDAPYKPTAGDWNWNFQWHSASSIIGGESSTGGQPFAGTVQTGVSFTDSGCGYNSSGNYANQEFAGYFTGGDIASGPQPKRRWCLNKPLQYDHWYDVYLHVIWSKSANAGLFHLEIDGQVISDLHQATLLYNSATGAVDVPNLELSNYRGPDPATGKPPTWSSTIYYDGVMLGPTKNSVQ